MIVPELPRSDGACAARPNVSSACAARPTVSSASAARPTVSDADVDYRFATAHAFVGRELGTTAWMTIDQPLIDRFAACMGDTYWLHVDPERAAREGPYGGTIAHGYLLLSLLGTQVVEAGAVPPDASVSVNYGLDRVRFVTPVHAGARVRDRVVLVEAQPRGNDRVLLRTRNTLEIEGRDHPALVADVSILVFR